MRALTLTAAILGALGLGPALAQEAEPIRIGFLATMSGPPGLLGQHQYEGFMLAMEEAGMEAAGRPIEVLREDDELDPDLAVTKVEALLERDAVDFMTGVTFSNIMMAVFRPITEAGVPFVGSNAGPSPIAGRRCSPYFFSTSWQNDQIHEVMGRYAADEGFARVFLLAPNYQAGRDSVAGFERHFDGEVVDTVYTPLGNLDFSAELARIASAEPDAVFTFMPGGMGVNLVKQFAQSGLADKVTFLSAFTVDEGTMGATKDDAVGLYGASQWAANLDTPGNAAFVSAYKETYGSDPTHYSAQGYDAAKLILSAIEAVDGDLSDTDAVLAALRAADFDSLRGDFSFNANGFPIQDFYLTQAVKADDGSYRMEAVQKVFDDYGDVYAAECGS